MGGERERSHTLIPIAVALGNIYQLSRRIKLFSQNIFTCNSLIGSEFILISAMQLCLVKSIQ